jgi:hypothetical protein
MLRISVHDLQRCVESAPSMCGVISGLQATAQRTTSEITHNVIFLARLLRFFNLRKLEKTTRNRAGQIVCVFSCLLMDLVQ